METPSRSRRFFELLKLENRPEDETIDELDLIFPMGDDVDAEVSAAAAAASAAAAATSATNAASSATAASSSATSASASETAAAASETAASTSETNAATSETNAATSATTAASSATASTTSKNQAATSASNASTSETNAAASETAAAASEVNAATSASSASTSSTASASSATSASTSATNAASSASSASTSATNAAASESAASTSESQAAASAASASSDADRAEAVLVNTRTLESFGVTGDSVIDSEFVLSSGTDDTTNMQAALDWCKADSSRRLLGSGGGIYRITSTLTGEGNFNLDLRGGTIFLDMNSTGLAWECPVVNSSSSLTSDYSDGDTSLTITGIGADTYPHSVVAKIVSNAVDPGDRDEGSNSTQYRVGEFFVTGATSTANAINLSKPLKFITGISPTSTAGEEARIDSYTTAMNARVAMCNNDTKFVLKNGKFITEGGHPSWTNQTMSIAGFVRPLVENVEILHGYSIGIKFAGTYQATARNVTVEQLTDDTPSGNFGYGIGDTGYGTTVENLHVKDVRHGYTSAVAKFSADTTDVHSMMGMGRTEAATIRGGTASESSSSPWDTHQSSNDVLFAENSVDTSSTGFSLRGQNITVSSPRIIKSNTGISSFTEYASGSPDDDFWTAGKEPEDVTSTHIISPTINCQTLPIYTSYAFCRLSGSGKIKTTDHAMLTNQGGSVIVEGWHEFTSLAGVKTHGVSGCVDISTTNGAMNDAFPNAVTIIEGTVLINARDATTSSIVGINLGNYCTLVVRGRLKIQLPSGSTYASLGTGASIRTENGGVIEVGIDGAADSTLFDPALMDGCDVKAVDGSAYWYDASDRVDTVRTYSEPDANTTLTGAATESSGFTPNGQKCWNHLVNERGGGHMRLELDGTKTGTNDATKFYIRSNTSNFVGTLECASFTNWFRMVLDVTVHSDGTQIFTGQLLCQDSDEDESTSSEKLRLLYKSETALPNADNNVPFIISILGDGATFDDIEIHSYRVYSDFGGHY